MIALDTNVLLYACDRADPKRQQTAIDLIANSRDGVLLWQVACEFSEAVPGHPSLGGLRIVNPFM